MKKVLALVLALTMVLGMGSVALAEGNAQVFWYTMSDTYLASVRTALNAKLDEAGITYVDQDGNATQTSIPGVFAAGDCTTVPYKQIIIATGEGAKASLSSFDYLIRTKTA